MPESKQNDLKYVGNMESIMLPIHLFATCDWKQL